MSKDIELGIINFVVFDYLSNIHFTFFSKLERILEHDQKIGFYYEDSFIVILSIFRVQNISKIKYL